MEKDIKKLFDELDKIIKSESYHQRINLYTKTKNSFIEFVNKLGNEEWQK